MREYNLAKHNEQKLLLLLSGNHLETIGNFSSREIGLYLLFERGETMVAALGMIAFDESNAPLEILGSFLTAGSKL